MTILRTLLTLPRVALCVAAVLAADWLEQREMRRDRERLDRVLWRVLADIEAEERETIRPTMLPVTEMRGVWVSKGGEC